MEILECKILFCDDGNDRHETFRKDVFVPIARENKFIKFSCDHCTSLNRPNTKKALENYIKEFSSSALFKSARIYGQLSEAFNDRGSYDIIVTDMNFGDNRGGDKEGLEILRFGKKLKPDLETMVITAYPKSIMVDEFEKITNQEGLLQIDSRWLRWVNVKRDLVAKDILGIKERVEQLVKQVISKKARGILPCYNINVLSRNPEEGVKFTISTVYRGKAFDVTIDLSHNRVPGYIFLALAKNGCTIMSQDRILREAREICDELFSTYLRQMKTRPITMDGAALQSLAVRIDSKYMPSCIPSNFRGIENAKIAKQIEDCQKDASTCCFEPCLQLFFVRRVRETPQWMRSLYDERELGTLNSLRTHIGFLKNEIKNRVFQALEFNDTCLIPPGTKGARPKAECETLKCRVICHHELIQHYVKQGYALAATVTGLG